MHYSLEQQEVRILLSVCPYSQSLKAGGRVDQANLAIEQIQRPSTNPGAILDPFGFVPYGRGRFHSLTMGPKWHELQWLLMARLSAQIEVPDTWSPPMQVPRVISLAAVLDVESQDKLRRLN